MHTRIRIGKWKIKWLINININYIRKFFAIEMHEFILINININYIRKFFAIEMLMLMLIWWQWLLKLKLWMQCKCIKMDWRVNTKLYEFILININIFSFFNSHLLDVFSRSNNTKYYFPRKWNVKWGLFLFLLLSKFKFLFLFYTYERCQQLELELEQYFTMLSLSFWENSWKKD